MDKLIINSECGRFRLVFLTEDGKPKISECLVQEYCPKNHRKSKKGSTVLWGTMAKFNIETNEHAKLVSE